MLLKDFEQELQDIARPARNDRDACEERLLATFEKSGLAHDEAAQHARHLALAMDLWPHDDSKPLYLWIDDRLTCRSPSDALPYDIGFASFLIAQPDGSYLFSIWEFAERNDRINLLVHHQDLPAPFSQHAVLEDILRSAPPSHQLYRNLRCVPFKYKPDTSTLLEAFDAPPDFAAQSRFLKKYFRIEPAIGR
jgi:hypothetical protein